LARTTCVLAALLAALGLYVYLVEVPGGERQDLARGASARLLPFASAVATELVIQRPDGRIVCRKVRGRWRIVAPVRVGPDETTVDRVLEAAPAPPGGRRAEEHPSALAAFGLARPLILTVATGGTRHSVQVGRESPTGEFVFARRVGQADSLPV